MTDFAKLKSQLNKEQLRAVETIEGPVMVIAGPGTGKTQVVAMRIGEILQKTQVNPNNILALTFTESGVTALRERLVELIGPTAYGVAISTFHGFANQVIATFPYVFAAAANLQPITDIERILTLETILSDHAELVMLRPLRQASYYISQISQKIKICKQEGISPQDLEKILVNTKKPDKKMTKAQEQSWENQQNRLKEFAIIYRLYNEALTKKGWYDYEDTIDFVVEALKNNVDVKAYYQERYQYLLVDEYQDTNNSQNALVGELARFFNNPNIFVVGDDKQAIYRFQGASVANMLHFAKRYPDIKIISLTTNYRSSPEILKSAGELINHNQHQINTYLPKVVGNLISDQQSGNKPGIIEADSEVSEFEFIKGKVNELHVKHKLPYSEIAVLWRKRADVTAFRSFLEKTDIPTGGEYKVDLLTERESQLITTLLHAIHNPLNDPATFQALELLLEPKDKLLLFKLNRAKDYKERLIEAASASNEESLKQTAQSLLTWHELSLKLSTVELIERLVAETNLLQRALADSRSMDSLSVLSSLYSLICQYVLDHPNESTLGEVINYLELITSHHLEVSIERFGVNQGVTIGTLHSVKGLEFGAVILAGSDEKRWKINSKTDLLPLPSTVIGLEDWVDDELEDERRLFYVGLTRAKKYLYITYSNQSKDGKPVLPCQFASELNQTAAKEDFMLSAEKLSQALTNQLTKKVVAPLNQKDLAFIRETVQSRPFAFSDLRAYQNCPRQYLLDRVLALPRLADETILYGNAIHQALDLFARDHRKIKHVPPKEILLDHFRKVVNQTVPYELKERLLNLGMEILAKFYDKKVAEWPIPVATEYLFTSHQVHLDDIWLTGKFDRMELIDYTARTVRVVEYKTKSKPMTRNEIEGKTKNSDGTYKQQLVFYAMLAELDKQFPYRVTEFVISFIDDKGMFSEETFKISQEEINAMKKEIKTMYQEILSRTDFDHNPLSIDRGCDICQAFPSI